LRQGLYDAVVRFGLRLVQHVGSAQELVELAALADEVGLASTQSGFPTTRS